MTLDDIVEEILMAENIVVLTHDNPDGDAVGSAMALYLGLKQLNKTVDVIMPEYPRIYDFLPDINEIKKEGKNQTYDLAIALDCGDIKRLNGFSNYFENANCRISIDHHRVNTMFGDYNFVNPAAAATCQVLIIILESLGIEITKDIGTCLVTGIITDTGGFKHSGVSAETFEFVAGLINRGVNVSNVYRKALQTMTKERLEMTKIGINRLEFIEDGKIAFTYVTREEQEEIKPEIGDYEGIVEIGREMEGVEVSIFLREQEEGYKVSLRSNEYVNVSEICLMFNGGGHLRAAGGTISGTLEQAKEIVLNECKKHLR